MWRPCDGHTWKQAKTARLTTRNNTMNKHRKTVTNLPISLYFCLYTCVFLLQVLSASRRIKLLNVTRNNRLSGEALAFFPKETKNEQFQGSQLEPWAEWGEGQRICALPILLATRESEHFYSRMLLQIIDAIMEFDHLVVYVVDPTFYIV